MFPRLSVDAIGSLLTCPYCYRQFRMKEIMFRCSGDQGTVSKCPTSRDHVLAEQMDEHDPQYPAFKANGKSMKTTHGECGAETHYRLCPHCHSQLPVLFGQTESRLIALVGAKNSGKTVYMTVLLHELFNDVGDRFNASVLGADEFTRKEFQDKYEKGLYERGELHGATKTAAAEKGGRRPLVFSVAIGSAARRDKVRRTVLSFFDTAGEDLTSQSKVDQNVRYLASADGIILLLDPLQMQGARAVADPDAVLPDERTTVDAPINVLARVIQLLQASNGKAGKRIDKPIAVAFSKMDALLGALPDSSPLRRRPPTKPGFDELDSGDVHRHMHALLHEWAGHNLADTVKNNFARYRFFGLSGLGRSPRVDSDGMTHRLSDGVPQPWRIEDPLLWLLSEFRVIPRLGKPNGGQ